MMIDPLRLTHERHERQVTRTLHGEARHALVLRAVPGALPREELPLRVALLRQRLEVLEVDVLGLLAAEFAARALTAPAVAHQPLEAVFPAAAATTAATAATTATATATAAALESFAAALAAFCFAHDM